MRDIFQNLTNFKQQAVCCEKKNKIKELQKHGKRISYILKYGFDFNQNGFRGEMKLPFAYRKNVEGLCGDWNSNKHDDLRLRDGQARVYSMYKYKLKSRKPWFFIS